MNNQHLIRRTLNWEGDYQLKPNRRMLFGAEERIDRSAALEVAGLLEEVYERIRDLELYRNEPDRFGWRLDSLFEMVEKIV